MQPTHRSRPSAPSRRPPAVYRGVHPSPYGLPPPVADRVRYPLAYAEPVRMTGRQRIASALFLASMIGLIAGAIYVFVGVLGFDSLTQLYGFEHVIETFDVEPPPRL